MSELHDFPIVNQLDSSTLDGRPDENREFNCVPSSLAAGLRYLTGRMYVPDELKDAAYGEGLRNSGTAAIQYVSYCAKQGVLLSPINGTPAYLVAQAHAQLALGHPVIYTEPDPYVAASLGWSHVCVWFQDTADTLTAMDPFGGHLVEKSNAEWISLVLFNQIWVMEKKEDTNVAVPAGWSDDGTTLTAPNGKKVVQGFRQYVLAHDWHPENVPLEDEHGLTQLETSNPSLGGGTQQAFHSTVLEWTQARGVFEMWTGNEILSLRAVAANLFAQIATLKAAGSDPVAEQAKSALQQIKPILASVMAKL